MAAINLFFLKYNNHKGFNLTELSTMLGETSGYLPDLIAYQYECGMDLSSGEFTKGPIKMIIGYVDNSQVIPEEWIYNKDRLTITPSVESFHGTVRELKRLHYMSATTLKVRSSDPILSRYQIREYDDEGDMDGSSCAHGLIKKTVR